MSGSHNLKHGTRSVVMLANTAGSQRINSSSHTSNRESIHINISSSFVSSSSQSLLPSCFFRVRNSCHHNQIFVIIVILVINCSLKHNFCGSFSSTPSFVKVILCASEHICSIVRYYFRRFKQL